MNCVPTLPRRGEYVKPSARASSLSLAFAALLLAGCADEKPDALLNSAKEHLAKKDSKAAVIQLKNALQEQPNLAEARFLLGRTLLDGGDPIAAELELRKALALEYPERTVLPPLATAMLAQGKSQRVIQDYASVEFADPAANAGLKVTLAKAYAMQGKNAEAGAALHDALRAAPAFAPALLLQSRISAGGGDLDAAVVLVEQVISQDPNDYEALQLKGDLLYYGKGDAVAALVAQRQALAIRKDWLPAHASMVEVLLSRSDLPAARRQLDELKKFWPRHPQTRFLEARLAYVNQDYKAAGEILQQVLKFAPENVTALQLASILELRKGSLAQAEDFAAKALRLAPTFALTRRLLAQIYLRSGDPIKAREALAPLLDSPDVAAETLTLAAEAALTAGDAKAAEAYYVHAAKLDPSNARSRTALALVQFSKGNSDLGFAQLQEIATTDKGTIADMVLISARLRTRNYDAALKAIDAMERKQPDRPFAAQLRGQVHLARNDAAAARQSFTKALAVDPLYFPATASLAALDLRDKRPEEARKRFDKLLEADPKNLLALLALAELRAQAGASWEELAGLLASAIRLNPGVAAPRLLLIDLSLRSGNSKAALTVAQDGVAALPDSGELLDALGRAQMAAGEPNQAINSFNKLAALQRLSPQPQVRLAETYLALKNRAAARERFKRALEIAPKYLPAQRGLVSLELSEGRPEQAMVVAHAVRSEQPEQYVGYMLAGDVDAWRKNYGAAVASYREGLKHGDATELATKLHALLVLANKPAEAARFADGRIREHPQDMLFRTYLGDRALASRDLALAEGHYRAVVQLQPDNADALNNLAWISNKLGKPEAAAFAERANALRPGVPAYMDTLANILSDAGQTGKALELEKKAIGLAPQNLPFRLTLARIYLKAGDKTLARAELETLAKLGDNFPDQAEVLQLLERL